MVELYLTDQENMQQIFPFLCEKKHCISIAGAGGKTTLLYLLAEYYAKRGIRTLVTTTTHIMQPEDGSYVTSIEEMQDCFAKKSYAVIGEQTIHGKIRMPEAELLRQCMALSDVVLIEADGAKRMACKVPNDTEPVILPETDIVIGVMGLEAVGQPLGKVCFRKEYACSLLNATEDHLLTEDDLVQILISEHGTRKHVGEREYYVVLNKCDQKQKLMTAKSMAEKLQAKGIRHVIISKLVKK